MNSSLSSYSMRSLDFSFQTSSGDTISLNLYNKENLDYSKNSSSNGVSQELLLKRERGMTLHYEGNGLDEQDKKEITQALKEVEDLLSSFLSPKQMQEEREQTKTTQKILDILSPLKDPKNEEKSNYLKSSLTDTFEDILKVNRQQENTFNILDNMFKSILEELEPFNYYA